MPEFYREETKGLWERYGLTKTTKGTGLGKVKRDMAMLFVARCLDRFTKENGRLAFLIPFTVYKTQAGAGFREFLAKGYWKEKKANSPCKVLKIHDLVTLYPFEGAVNRTSLVVIEKSGETEFPIPCVMWHNPRSKGIDQEAELEEVRKTTKQFDLVFIPIEKNKPESPWREITEKSYISIQKILGKPHYKGSAAAFTNLNGVYWANIISQQPNGLLIKNVEYSGLKKKIKVIKKVIEPDLIYPLIRGRDLKKWFGKPSGFIILPTNKEGNTFSHSELKLKYPKTFSYFQSFFNELINRGAEPYKSKLAPYKKMPLSKAEKLAPPFYWIFNAKPSLYPYKVAWKYISGKISGKCDFEVSIITPVNGKSVIPGEGTVMFIPLSEEKEAYYLAGILNSSPITFFINSYAMEIHASTYIIEPIKLPKFNPKNPHHQKLSQLSQKAHEIAKKIYEENREDLKEDLKKIEEEIDKTVAELYGITDDELKEIRKCLVILKEGEISEEEEKDEEEQIILPKKDIEIKVNPLLIEENKQQELTISVQNNTDKPIKDVKLEVKLKSKSLLTKTIKEVKQNDLISLKFRVPKLKSGEYELELHFSSQDVKFKEPRKLFVKKKKITKKIKSSLNNELEGLLR